MQLSGHGGRWRVLFPTSTIVNVWVGDCFADGFLVLLSLAFVLSVVVLALAFWGVTFTFAFPAAALLIPSRSVIGGGTAGVEGLSAAAGRIRG